MIGNDNFRTMISKNYFHLLDLFDPFFDEFLLFLMDLKWRENPHSDSPQIFVTLKLQKQFWKILQCGTSLEINS